MNLIEVILNWSLLKSFNYKQGIIFLLTRLRRNAPAPAPTAPSGGGAMDAPSLCDGCFTPDA